MKMKVLWMCLIMAGFLAGSLWAQGTNVNVTITYVSSGKTYQVDFANPGVKFYIDRPTGTDPGHGYRFLPDALTATPALETTAPTLLGMKFIRTSNDDKALTVARHLEFTIDKPCTIYMAYDKRGTDIADFLQDGTWTLTTMTMSWTNANATPAADGSSPMPIYSKDFMAGTVTLPANKQGTTAGVDTGYIPFIVPKDPTFNPPPSVNAGPDQVFAKPIFPLVVTMAATVTDQDPIEGTPGTLTRTWSMVSGPAAVTFSDATAEDPTATFTAPGEYVLKLAASDSDKSSEDTMRVYINDTTKNMLMAHWNFESISETDPNIVDVVKGNNARWVSDDPNLLLRPTRKPVIVPGWVTGSAKAVDFSGAIPSHADVTIANTEPNFVNSPRYAMTISAWIKVNAFTRDWSNVISKGDDSWRIARLTRTNTNHNALIAQFSGPTPGTGFPANGPNTSISVNDNFWHHVCGTYDGQMIRTYLDGVLDVEAPYSGFINTSTYPIQIAGNSQQLTTGQTSGRQWDGVLDEIKLYNYALSETDIRAETGRGKTIPFVDAGTLTSPLTYKTGEQIPLNGQVLDYGIPSAVTALWTTVTGPDGAEAIFASPSSPTTTVQFPAFGQYTLRLSAADDLATAIDEITVDVVRPTCADVKTAGMLMVGDLDENCRVNLADFAILAADWLRCNDPANYPACFWAFPQ